MTDDAKKVSDFQQAKELIQHRRDIVAKFHVKGDLEHYDLEHLESRLDASFNFAAGELLNNGRRLVQIKEHEPTGTFLAVLERRGIGVRLAQQLMQIARTYDTPARMKMLGPLGKTKALQLMTELDSDELDALAEGEEVLGATADTYARMTKREMRKHFDDAKAELKAKDQVLERIQQENHRLHRELHRTDDLEFEISVIKRELPTIQENALQIANHALGISRLMGEIMERAPENQISDDLFDKIQYAVGEAVNAVNVLAKNTSMEPLFLSPQEAQARDLVDQELADEEDDS